MDNTSKLLNYLNATRSASSEEDYNELFALLDPSTEDEMGGIYESVLGYNPIKYFDIQFLSDAITKGCESLPEEYMATIVDNKDEIITLTMDYFTDNKGEILTDILSEILEKYLPTAEIKKFINATGFEYETFIDDDDDDENSSSLDMFDDESDEFEVPAFIREKLEHDNDDDDYDEED